MACPAKRVTNVYWHSPPGVPCADVRDQATCAAGRGCPSAREIILRETARHRATPVCSGSLPSPTPPRTRSSAVLPTGKEGPWGASGGWGRQREQSDPAATLADQGTDRSWRLWAVRSQQEVPGRAEAQLKMNLGAIPQRSLGEGRHHSTGIREFMLSSAVTTRMCLSVSVTHTRGREAGTWGMLLPRPTGPCPSRSCHPHPRPYWPQVTGPGQREQSQASPSRPGGGAGCPVSFLTRWGSSPLKCPPPCSSRCTHVPGEPPSQAAGWGLTDTPVLSVVK